MYLFLRRGTMAGVFGKGGRKIIFFFMCIIVNYFKKIKKII